VCSVVRKASLRDVRGDNYLPHMAIVCHHERGSTDIFRPHTESSACGRCAFFTPWTAGEKIFSGVRESGLRDEHAAMRVAHGDAMVAMVYFAREKNEFTITTFTAPNRFFLFFTYPHVCRRAQQPNHFAFQDV
jgi:hypothetical protein